MNQGSITRDPARGTWQFVIDAPTNGKRKQIKRRGFSTKREAITALNELRKQEHTLALADRAIATERFLLNIWLPQRAPSLRQTTYAGYEKTIRNTINPELGHLPIHDINRRTLEHLYTKLMTTGGRHHNGLSSKTISNIHGIISKALNDAVRWDYLHANPAAGAQLPKTPRPEMAAWTAQQAANFLNHHRNQPRHTIWQLVLTTGIRRGELCGLKWKHLDPTNHTITITETRVVANHVITSTPKTQAGHRTIHISQELVHALLKLQQHNNKRHQLMGQQPSNDNYIVEDNLGEPPHPETVTRWWNTDVATTNNPKIRLHDARHTAATLLFRNGTPHKVITQRLGHSDIATTMRLYQHVTPEDDREAASTLQRLLKPTA